VFACGFRHLDPMETFCEVNCTPCYEFAPGIELCHLLLAMGWNCAFVCVAWRTIRVYTKQLCLCTFKCVPLCRMLILFLVGEIIHFIAVWFLYFLQLFYRLLFGVPSIELTKRSCCHSKRCYIKSGVFLFGLIQFYCFFNLFCCFWWFLVAILHWGKLKMHSDILANACSQRVMSVWTVEL